MPPGPGETLLVTLFGDVHYYFSPPAPPRPQHHRFSRSSYVYLFHNASTRHTVLEIANHPGTAEQDAFSGFLDAASVSYSYKQPTVVTLLVDGSRVQGHDTWHLPAWNERNEQKYLYKIHSIDIYFWTEKDAASFLGHLKAALSTERLDIKHAPSAKVPEHRDSMSPVVQQLERTAINTQIKEGDSPASARSSQSVQQPAVAPMAYNPAAPPAPEPIAHREKTPPPPDAGSGTGLANAEKYEAIPKQNPQFVTIPQQNYPNSTQTTPQNAYFTNTPFEQQQQQQPQQGQHLTSFPGSPQGASPGHQTTGVPPPPPGGTASVSPPQQAPSFAPPPLQQSPPQPHQQQQSYTASPPQQQPFSGPPTQQFASYPTQQQKAPPSFGPGAIASPGLTPFGASPPPSQPPPYAPQYQQQTPGYHPTQQQPQPTHRGSGGGGETFGFSQYSYAQAPQGTPYGYGAGGGGYAGDVHGQVYRPTAGEQGAHGGHGGGAHPAPPPRTNSNLSETRQRVEGRVADVEQRVGKFMKKLDRLL